MLKTSNKEELAYIIGIAIGDGNLSNPNGRAVRLRITCDKNYSNLIKEIIESLKKIAPNNKISTFERKDNCIDISCYSNDWEEILGWKASRGSKIKQGIKIPDWIKKNKIYTKKVLKGLIQTDGSIYFDRKYKMVNFTSASHELVEDVSKLVKKIGFKGNINKRKDKSIFRISKDVDNFIKEIDIKKEKNKPKIIVVLGQTATGKSDMAVEIAKDFNGEIISADSRQVYRGLDIGSGKITEEEMQGIPHYLLDVVSPNTVFTVTDFQRKTYKAIDDILSRGKVPIIAGGTAFYIQSIVDGLIFPKIKEDKELRKQLEKLSIEKLQQKLKKLDLERFSEIDQKNKVRLVRAIEIATLNKNADGESTVPKLKKESKYNVLQIGLRWPKEILNRRIHDRLIARAENGMIEEVEKLHNSGVSWRRLEELGLEYKYIAQYLKSQNRRNKISHSEMLEVLENKIRQFSKRQMTWWKRDNSIKWFSPKEYPKVKKEIKNFYK
jgi:tRNA dimethylallyltransferase